MHYIRDSLNTIMYCADFLIFKFCLISKKIWVSSTLKISSSVRVLFAVYHLNFVFWNTPRLFLHVCNQHPWCLLMLDCCKILFSGNDVSLNLCQLFIYSDGCTFPKHQIKCSNVFITDSTFVFKSFSEIFITVSYILCCSLHI